MKLFYDFNSLLSRTSAFITGNIKKSLSPWDLKTYELAEDYIKNNISSAELIKDKDFHYEDYTKNYELYHIGGYSKRLEGKTEKYQFGPSSREHFIEKYTCRFEMEWTPIVLDSESEYKNERIKYMKQCVNRALDFNCKVSYWNGWIKAEKVTYYMDFPESGRFHDRTCWSKNPNVVVPLFIMAQKLYQSQKR
jgi:hypothetical protein